MQIYAQGTVRLHDLISAKLPISIHPGMAIGQISFLQMTTPVDNPYRGKYQGQSGPTASAFHREFERGGPSSEMRRRPDAGRSQELAMNPPSRAKPSAQSAAIPQSLAPPATRSGASGPPRPWMIRAARMKQAWMT